MNIGIAGSGPSAIYAIKHLISSEKPLHITVYEAGELAGVGTPYDPCKTPVALLANIASIELPPVIETLHEFLARCDSKLLAQIGVDLVESTDRTFHPRVALGAYYAAQLEALSELAGARGHVLTITTRCPVVDICPETIGVLVKVRQQGRQPESRLFDKVILATGHTVPRTDSRNLTNLIYDDGEGSTFGILGSSLSAIDIVVSLAMARGRFDEHGYEFDAGQTPFKITMMSRGGRLPEADFYCPLPAVPLSGFSQHDVEAYAAKAPAGAVLDLVFARFAERLTAEDPCYAAHINLSNLTADTFDAAYFRDRDACEPLAWARRNLAEAKRNATAKITVPWRYTILRCHEAFAACLPFLTHTEMQRFNRGLKKVFVDNYAAVPPQSIDRLLALHDAGVFNVIKLGDEYSINVDDTSRGTVSSSNKQQIFDKVYDARGQAAFDADDLPFPTLRFLLTSNHRYELDDTSKASVTVDRVYQITSGLNPLDNIWCLSLPFLLSREPFIQGLTSAAKLGEAAAAGILGKSRDAAAEQPIGLQDLVDRVHETDPVILNGNIVVLAPKTE